MLVCAGEVHEAEIDGPDFLLSTQSEHFFWGHGFGSHGLEVEYESGIRSDVAHILGIHEQNMYRPET